MGQLWRHDGRAWQAHPLTNDASVVAGGPVVLSTGTAADGTWLLLAPVDAGIAVNGEIVRLGLVALRDRDEIRLGSGERLYFAAEDAPVVVPLIASAPGLRCARCRRLLSVGEPIVRCPGTGCGLVHHETVELPCWSYDACCAVCAQPTAFDPAERWTPEAL